MKKYLCISVAINILLIFMYASLVTSHWNTLDKLENLHNEKVTLQTIYVNNVPYTIELEFDVEE